MTSAYATENIILKSIYYQNPSSNKLQVTLSYKAMIILQAGKQQPRITYVWGMEYFGLISDQQATIENIYQILCLLNFFNLLVFSKK